MSDKPAPPTQLEYWNSKVAEEWVRQADRTDKMFGELTQATFRSLNLQPGERVLDIGCGAGETTLSAARQVDPKGRAVGVDISRPLLELGRKRAKEHGFDVDFIEADAGAVDVPGAPFDAAFSRFGVMFFENPEVAFTQIRKNLKPNGRLSFICWRPYAENFWSETPLSALTPMLGAPLPPPIENVPGPFGFANPQRTESILKSAGWREIAINPWDGQLNVGADAKDATYFVLKIGPSARAIAEHGLDAQVAKQLIEKRLEQELQPNGVWLDAACWIVTASA